MSAEKPLFIRQCEALVQTLQLVKKEVKDTDLVMSSWVDTSPKEPKHFCGTAACICGYQAINMELDLFPEAKELRESMGNELRFSPIASFISEDMEEACKSLTNRTSLARAIYDDSPEFRFNYAEESELFTDFQLRSLKHLMTHEPTFDDAIAFIQAVIDKCEEHYCGESS